MDITERRISLFVSLVSAHCLKQTESRPCFHAIDMLFKYQCDHIWKATLYHFIATDVFYIWQGPFLCMSTVIQFNSCLFWQAYCQTLKWQGDSFPFLEQSILQINYLNTGSLNRFRALFFCVSWIGSGILFRWLHGLQSHWSLWFNGLFRVLQYVPVISLHITKN